LVLKTGVGADGIVVEAVGIGSGVDEKINAVVEGEAGRAVAVVEGGPRVVICESDRAVARFCLGGSRVVARFLRDGGGIELSACVS
jgi:hypothetical protein